MYARSFTRRFPAHTALPFWLLFGLYALMGFADAALGVAWNTLLPDNSSVTPLATALFLGTAAALPLFWWGGRALEGRDKRPVLTLAVLALLLALASALSGQAPLVLLGAFLLVPSVAALELGVSGHALELGKAVGRVQAGFAVGAVLGALSSGLLTSQGALGALLGLAVMGALILLPLAWVTLNPASTGTQATRSGGLPLTAFAALAVVAAFSEGVMLSWSGLYLERERGLSTLSSGLLSSLYFVAFGLGAWTSSALLARFGARRTLDALLLGAAAGAALLVLSPGLALATMGMLLLGFSLAGVLPTLLEGRSSQFTPHSPLPTPQPRSSGVGAVLAFAYLGMLLEPLAAQLAGEHLETLLAGLALLLTGSAALRLWPRLERAARTLHLLRLAREAARAPLPEAPAALSYAGD